MTLPEPKTVTMVPTPRRLFGPGLLLVVVALLLLIAFGYCASRLSTAAFLGSSPPVITHDIVVQQVRNVAKLVSSEATVRDVVSYQNTWYGSTKKSLVVVTGRLLAGIDLKDNPDVRIDNANRRITIRIPPAKLIALEIRDTAALLRLSRVQRSVRVYLPAALPTIFAGLRTALSIGLVLVVISELNGEGDGLGVYIESQRALFNVSEMYVGIVFLGLLGYVLNRLFLVLEHRVLAWHYRAIGEHVR